VGVGIQIIYLSASGPSCVAYAYISFSMKLLTGFLNLFYAINALYEITRHLADV
jgi:hypothetical protein